MNRYKFDKENHLHTLDGQALTGTSSVADVLAKPLTWWASGLAVKEFGCPDGKLLTKIKNKTATAEEVKMFHASAGVMLEKIKVMGVEEYIKLIDRAYRAHASTLKEKAKDGTDLHAELERFVRDEMDGKGHPAEHYAEQIRVFIDWARSNVERYLWSEAHCYSEKHWVGGISDLGLVDKNGKVGIFDFKSSKEAYLSQFWQCAGYGIQLMENGGFDADGNRLFGPVDRIDYYAVVPFGMDNPIPQVNVDVAGGVEAFLAELLLYRKLPRQ